MLARDQLQVYVNGKLVGEQELVGYPVAVVADLAPYLTIGRNVVAITAKESSVGQPPVVAVEGAYAVTDGEYGLGSDGPWRCSSAFERGASWWFSTSFDDHHWPYARLAVRHLRARVKAPPRAVTVTDVGRWITPDTGADGSASIHRDFEVADRPRQAWLRVTSASSYRLAVNGILIDRRENPVTTARGILVRRTYDITTVVQQGPNTLSLLLVGNGETPHLLADLEVEDHAGGRYQLGTDARWIGRPGQFPDWLRPPPGGGPDGRPCAEESGDLGVPPWQPSRMAVDISLPLSELARRLAEEVGLVALVAALTLLACRSMARRLSDAWGVSRKGETAPARVVYLALVPATLGIAGAVLATYDPRVDRQDVYRGLWAVSAVASVLFQWMLLAAVRGRPRSGPEVEGVDRPRGDVQGTRVVVAVLIALMAIGFWVRVRDLETEPLQWDEVENYEMTLGLLERGFPSRKIHDDLPVDYVHTSELFFVPPALTALILDSDLWVIRLPGVCWNALTILLIFVVGRRLFSTSVGLVAATLYTFSPVVIAMSVFGRYFAQLQFLTLLTVYYFWLTIRGIGPIDRRALWLTAISFIATYLTWEASALIAPAMMLAALVQRRGRLRAMLVTPSVWLGMLVVLMAVALQFSHINLQQTQYLWYGTSLSDVELLPMWRYQFFHPWDYVWQTSWSNDTLLPMLGLLGTVVLAARHRMQQAVRFLLLIHLPTCLLMALLLPAYAERYVHHLIPLLILLVSATVVAFTQALAEFARREGTPAAWVYAGCIGGMVTVAMLAMGSGAVLDLSEMPALRVEGYRPGVFKFPNLEGPAQYVCEHMREGDVVLANDPFHVRYLMGRVGWPERSPDFWLETKLTHPATLDDHRPLPLDRRDGTLMIPNLETLEDLFTRHERIWYIVQPERHWDQNLPEVSDFLRLHMEVVYEDHRSLVLFHGANHRSASVLHREHKVMSEAPADFLP